MSELIVIAKLVARKESVDEVKTELLKLIEPTRKENGCREYWLQQDRDDPAVFIFSEIWESMAHLEKHIGTDHYQEYTTAVEGMIVSKVVNKMNRIA